MGTACITGATSGIGLSIARQLAGHGHDVVLVARNVERLEQVADEVRQQFRVRAEVVPADLTSLADTKAVEARLADRNQPIEWLVNNAGFGFTEPFDASDVNDEQAMLDVLVRAPMRLTHAALPGMVARGRGRVLLVSSVAGFLPSGTYSAAKAWTTVFAESLAERYRSAGVHVTALCPGYTHTEFHERADMDTSSVPDWMWLDADAVARDGLVACAAGRAVSVPGAQYKGITSLVSVLPRPLLRRIVGGR